jgi:sodium-dependent dicarboxylate transporter 2/3/5
MKEDTDVTASDLSKKRTGYYINAAIGIALMFLFGYLPNIGSVSDIGMTVLGILLGLIWLWSTCDMGWPTFAALTALLLTGSMNAADLYVSAFSNFTTLFCLFMFIVILPLADCGLFDYVTAWVLKRKLLQNKPWRLTAAIFLVCYVGNLLQGGFAVLLMLYSLVFKICDTVGMPKTHRWPGAMLMGITCVSVCATSSLPFLTGPLFVMGLLSQTALAELPFLTYILFSFFISLLLTLLYMAVMRFILRVDVSLLQEVDVAAQAKSLPPMSKKQRACTTLLLAYVVGIILVGSAGMMPAGAIKTVLSNLGLIGLSWIFICIMLIGHVDGEPISSLKEMGAKNLWEAILIVLIGITVGNLMLNPDLGIGALLQQIASPLFGGLEAYLFTFVLLVLSLVLTNIFNNTVVLMLMAQVFAVYSASVAGLNIFAVMAMMVFASNLAFLLPGASVMGAIVHGQSVFLGKKNLYLWASVVIVCSIITFAVAIPVGSVFF